MKKRWQTEWKTSRQYANSNKINSSLPSDNFLHIISQLCHNQASLLIQLCTGYTPLNITLHQIKWLETPECPYCKNGIHETIHHYLLTCPSYTGVRQLLQARLQHKVSSIPFLLRTQKGILHLLRYISNTKHLTVTFREVHPDDNFTIREKVIEEEQQQQDNDDWMFNEEEHNGSGTQKAKTNAYTCWASLFNFYINLTTTQSISSWTPPYHQMFWQIPTPPDKPKKNKMEGKRKDERGEGEEWDMLGQAIQAWWDGMHPGETTLITHPHSNPLHQHSTPHRM